MKKGLVMNLIGLGAALVAGGCGAEGDRAVPQDGDRQAAVGATADQAAFDRQNVFGKGEPNAAYAKYFVGNSYLKAITDRESGFPMANVTFEPGTRNNWHIHHAKKGGGQVLIATAGSGWYQLEGKPAVSLNPGDAVVIPANVKHWHGAKKDSWFSHIAFEVPGEGLGNEWLEPVSDEEYGKLAAAPGRGGDERERRAPITVNLRYTGADGAARKFAEEMTAGGTVAAIRAEKGNLRYEYFQSLDDPETVLLVDSWTDQEAVDAHHASPMMETIAKLREKHDLHMTVERYTNAELPETDGRFIRK